MISKKYLNYLPLDPRVNQFYAYWKTLDNSGFEIASVLVDDWDYITKVEWNYNWQEIVWLIREYNWPQFLYDNISDSYPYNPIETKMTARIASYTGSVSINWDNTNILSKVLTAWTKIQTSANSNAIIFYSDWSRSTLEENSSLEIKEMNYLKSEQKHNLLTSVKLFLENGTIWTKASRLNQDGSEFEITTQDATAAVRWTIFWVQRKNWQTNITLIIGKLDIKNNQWNLIEELIVNPWNPKKQISIKNWVKQATAIPLNFIDKEEIFPSNLKLKIESIKENSGKQINIVNTFSDGKLFVNNNPFACNNNWNLLECNVWTIPNNSKAKFCLELNWYIKSCTNEIIVNNLVYTKVKENIPTNHNIENISNLASNPSVPADTSAPEDSWTSTTSSPSYTPCNWNYTSGCIVTLWTHKLQLTSWPHNWNWCWWFCWGWDKTGHWFLHNWFWWNNKKYCKKLININWWNVLCSKKHIQIFWPDVYRENRSWNNWYTFEEVH